MPLACRRTELSIVFERNHAATPLSCSVAATLTTPEYETASATRTIRTMAARKPDANLITDLLLANRVNLAVPPKPAESCLREHARCGRVIQASLPDQGSARAQNHRCSRSRDNRVIGDP